MTKTNLTPVHSLAHQNYPQELRGACCFISDLHLTTDMPRTLVQFEKFCQTIAPQFRSLIILGDLFEYWLGDDTADDNPIVPRVISALNKLKQRDIFIGFMAGNRDFLLGTLFARRAGISLLPDPCVMKIHNQKVLLTHGDLLCINDTGYQRFRKLSHIKWVQKLFLAAPLTSRRTLAHHLRNKSKQREANSQVYASHLQKLNIPANAAASWFKQYDVRFIIHGHTHQPSTHLTFDTTRIVLPDWECEKEESARWGYVDWSQAEPVLKVMDCD